jgi:hypothetical protein|tara:strand:- start:2342 stop:2671 length:330 start_codon:yes stop_codon:yes gene_type:complete
MATFEELEKDIIQLKEDRETERGLIDDQNNQIIELQGTVEDLENRDLPEHFHKIDRISFEDIQGGVKVLNSTVSGVSEQGVIKVYTVGSTSYFAVKVGSTWKKAELSDV